MAFKEVLVLTTPASAFRMFPPRSARSRAIKTLPTCGTCGIFRLLHSCDPSVDIVDEFYSASDQTLLSRVPFCPPHTTFRQSPLPYLECIKSTVYHMKYLLMVWVYLKLQHENWVNTVSL